MQAAAVALTLGWNPFEFLTLSRDDEAVAYAVLSEAERIRGEHDKAIADYTANRTAGLIAPVIVKNTTRMMRWLGKSLAG